MEAMLNYEIADAISKIVMNLLNYKWSDEKMSLVNSNNKEMLDWESFDILPLKNPISLNNKIYYSINLFGNGTLGFNCEEESLPWFKFPKSFLENIYNEISQY